METNRSSEEWNPADLMSSSNKPKDTFLPVLPEVVTPNGERGPVQGKNKIKSGKKRVVAFALGVSLIAIGAGSGYSFLPEKKGEDATVITANEYKEDIPKVVPAPLVTPTPESTPNTEAPIESIINEVKWTVAVSYPNLVTSLTADDKKSILALASRVLAEGEEVVVSGFAGSTASVDFGQEISEKRAQVIQKFLQEQGIQASVVGYGITPVGQVLGEAQDKSVSKGISRGRLDSASVADNRLAFVSAVVLSN